jgi:hypothetical protein
MKKAPFKGAFLSLRGIRNENSRGIPRFDKENLRWSRHSPELFQYPHRLLLSNAYRLLLAQHGGQLTSLPNMREAFP